MLKILKYSFFDLIRSRWSLAYLLFYLVLTVSLLFLTPDLSKSILTLMNVVVLLTPLIGSLFGVMVYYDSEQFTRLLLALPVKRSHIFLGQYLGLAFSLSLSLIIGLGLPFALYGLFESEAMGTFLNLLILGIFLTFIFSALSFLIGLLNENRMKGFAYAILMWLFMVVIYDGIFLVLLHLFSDYPLERFTLFMSLLNPTDLARTMVLLNLNISALLGYTGAVFKAFFGSQWGVFVSFSVLSLWTLFPIVLIGWVSKRKDF